MHHYRIILFFSALTIGLAIICNRTIMEKFYELVGRVFFRRQQDWERRKNAMIMTWVLVFCAVLAVLVSQLIKMIYSHTR